jgi:hypothetical protein
VKDVKQVWWLFYDYGGMLSVAKKLAEQSAGVFYFCPKIINGYPDHRPLEIGRGIPGLIPIEEYEKYIDQFDAVCFGDVHEPEKQKFFQRIGKYVVGPMDGAKLELDRVYLKNKMMEVGLPINDWESADGLDELTEVLKRRPDVWVKSRLRGDMESWHSKDALLSQEDMDELRHRMDTYKQSETYTVEAVIKSIAEVGKDSFCVDGRFPDNILVGLELKATGYLGKATRYRDIPKSIRNVFEKLSPLLAELRHRGPAGDEVMIGEDGKGYLLDWTARFPQPPGDLYLEMIEGIADVLWKCAQGIVPDVQFKAKYGVQLIIKSDLAKTRAVRIRVPEEYKDNVKLSNMSVDENGLWVYTPQGVLDQIEIGSVIAMGDTAKKACDLAVKVAESIEGNNIKIDSNCLKKAYEQIDRLKKAGMTFFDAV